MVEQGPPPPTSESSNSPEGEGLSREHWDHLVAIPFEDSKINRFAQAVLDGIVSGDVQTHRQYLGRRHWQSIASQKIRDKVETPRRFLPSLLPKRVTYVQNPLALEIQQYAKSESEAVFTLDDFIYELTAVLTIPRYTYYWINGREECHSDMMIGYDGERQQWYKESEYQEEEYYQGNVFGTGRFTTSRTYFDAPDWGSVWLLEENEIPKDTSIPSMTEALRKVTLENPGEVQMRMAKTAGGVTFPLGSYNPLVTPRPKEALLRSLHFGILEKEI